MRQLRFPTRGERVALLDPMNLHRKIARSTSLDGLFHEYCSFLQDLGIPLDRVNLAVRTLHPLLVGIGLYWSPTERRRLEFAHGELSLDRFRNSPLRPLFFGETDEVRRRLADPDCPMDFAILEDLKPQGFTDYAAMSLEFTAGQRHVLTYATRTPGGFTDTQLDALREATLFVTPFVELREAWRVGSTLLNTYVGPRSGQRVLQGKIHPGDGEQIKAVIWWCDLRGFSELSERSSSSTTLAVLNAYFELVAEHVAEADGEILKFIGDGLLAIFPVDQEKGLVEVSLAAIAAARAVQRKLPEVRVPGFDGTLRTGIALHVGEATWGNIGAPGRLDFTVIGTAVNLVSRIEGLCRPLGQPILMSNDLAHAAGLQTKPCGEHMLKGVREPQAVWAP